MSVHSYLRADEERVMKNVMFRVASCTIAVIALLYPGNDMAARSPRPIVVRIDDVPDGPPVVTVSGAPNGWNLYTGPLVANPSYEDGGIITLFGVNPYGEIDTGDGGWRFVDQRLPADSQSNATDIVWIQHDWNGDGSLQVGFNTIEDGGYYRNPDYLAIDANAGPATNRWVTIYSDSTLLLKFRPRYP
jgi:hypothetical protein